MHAIGALIMVMLGSKIKSVHKQSKLVGCLKLLSIAFIQYSEFVHAFARLTPLAP